LSRKEQVIYLMKCCLAFNKLPFEIRLLDPIPLVDSSVVVGGGSENMHEFAIVDESNAIPSTTAVVEVDLQVSLMSMSILVPEGNLTCIIAVGSQLVDDKVGINSRVNEVVPIGSLGNSPSEIGLMTMSVTVPDAEFGVVMGGSTKDMSNCVRGKLGNNKHLFSASCEVVWIFIWSGVNWDETPMEI